MGEKCLQSKSNYNFLLVFVVVLTTFSAEFANPANVSVTAPPTGRAMSAVQFSAAQTQAGLKNIRLQQSTKIDLELWRELDEKTGIFG